MKNKRIEGNIGEQLAVEYLAANGYKVVERNFIAKGGEIDVIAYKDSVIVFIEVKNRNSKSFGESIEAVTPAKVKSITLCARQYIHSHRLYDRQIRFDIIAIYNEEIEHITDAFWAN